MYNISNIKSDDVELFNLTSHHSNMISSDILCKNYLDIDIRDCVHRRKNRYFYFGDVNVTMRGEPCLSWQNLYESGILPYVDLRHFRGEETWSSLGNKCRYEFD